MASTLAIAPRLARMVQVRQSRAGHSLWVLKSFLLGLPIWWFLGTSFMMPMFVAAAMFIVWPAPQLRFALSDMLLASIIAVLVGSGYINGFLVAGQSLRFMAALYNIAIWVSGLIVAQQVRTMLANGDAASREIYRAAFWAFIVMVTLSWASFFIAYVRQDFDQQILSLFGLLAGDQIPESAALIRQSTTVVFTKPDWGLPGVPMPRIGIYGPYPNATAAATAVLGTLALFHLQGPRRFSKLLRAVIGFIIICTLTITLSRSILGGWLAGLLAAHLLFGSMWTRLGSGIMVVAAVVVLGFISSADVGGYRQYSTESRFDNYYRAIDETMSSNPAFGLGMKPREEISHIAVGSHSTFVSVFTKGGLLGLVLVVIYLVILPGFRWLRLLMASGAMNEAEREQLRMLLTLQMTVLAWLAFEDLDAPATAAILIFIFFAVFESVYGKLDGGSKGNSNWSFRLKRT